MKRLAVLFIAGLVFPAFGVTTQHWTHTTEADFKLGTLHNAVATNLGDLKLSRAVKTLLEQSADVDAVYALAEAPDKTIYAGTGPKGVIYQIKDDKVSPLTTLEDAGNIFSLLVDAKGALLIGTGGEKGRIYRLEKGRDKPKVIFEADDVQYVWAIRQTADGNLYAATGPSGQLYEIKPDGTSKVLLDCEENNLLSLATDGKDNLYAGTDPNGLIYRINRNTGDAFVMYDAAESEISGLVLDGNGNLYASTGQSASEAVVPPGNIQAPEQNGRPEKDKGNDADPLPETAPVMPLMMQLDNPGDAPGAGDKPQPPNPKSPVENAPHPPAGVPGVPPTASDAAPAEGNAIYRIDPSGTVTEIFRESLPIVSLIESNGKLLAGTGGEGMIYQITPGSDENIVLAKVDAKEVMALLALSDGRVMLGMANAGSIGTMDKGFAAEGTFLSPVLDAAQISQFGTIQMHGLIPDGTKLTIAARSGNLQEPNDKTWSKWTDDAPAGEFVNLHAPGARFFQYRISLSTSNAGDTPVLEDVDIAYLPPNLAPQVKSIKITASAKNTAPADADHDASQAASLRYQTIAWEGTDANTDALEYALYFRVAPKGQWILLKDKLKEATYEWDTRGAADGRYEIKVIASDEKANPAGKGKTGSRLSDPVMVDNTSAVIGDIKTVVEAGVVKIDCRIVDRSSTVKSLEYAIDSAVDWQAASAFDNIFDQPEESASIKVSGLTPGAHQITLRATDARGNQAFESVTVRIESPTATK